MATLTVRIPDDKHGRLKTLAQYRHISVNKLIEELLKYSPIIKTGFNGCCIVSVITCATDKLIVNTNKLNNPKSLYLLIIF